MDVDPVLAEFGEGGKLRDSAVWLGDEDLAVFGVGDLAEAELRYEGIVDGDEVAEDVNGAIFAGLHADEHVVVADGGEDFGGAGGPLVPGVEGNGDEHLVIGDFGGHRGRPLLLD